MQTYIWKIGLLDFLLVHTTCSKNDLLHSFMKYDDLYTLFFFIHFSLSYVMKMQSFS